MLKRRDSHPDKDCDRIVDAILDAHLTGDADSRVACEVLAKADRVVLADDRHVPAAVGDWHRPDLDVVVNPSDRFTEGGPAADCGVTGRKIIVDTYGGAARHGGPGPGAAVRLAAGVQPSLAVDVEELSFGTETDEMVFEVWNDGSGELVYGAVVDDEAAPYFTVEPADGISTGPDDRQPHTVTLDRDLLESGQLVTGAIMLHAEHADDAPQYVTLRAEGVVVGVADVPEAFAFHPCYPNPCNPQTPLAVDLPREAVVTVSVFDLRGRRVRRLIASEPRPAGRHRIVWDARGDDGGRVASGIYLCRFEAGDYRERRSLTVIE